MAIDIKITSDDTIEHDGKHYRPVAIRKPKKGDTILLHSGRPIRSDYDYRTDAYIIVEEVIPPYRVPTDEDEKHRPIAEFWGLHEDPEGSEQGVLLSVLDSSPRPFVGLVDDVVAVWRYCRIPNEGATK